MNTKVLVFEDANKKIIVDGKEIDKLYAWSSGVLTNFYITHGKKSVKQFLLKYYNYVEYWPNSYYLFRHDVSDDFVVFFIKDKKYK